MSLLMEKSNMVFSITTNDTRDGWLVRVDTPEKTWVQLADCTTLWVAEVLVRALKEHARDDEPDVGPATTTAT